MTYCIEIPNGYLVLYGKNLKKCMPYIRDVVGNIERVYKYCSIHEINICYKRKSLTQGLKEFLFIKYFSAKYSVYGSKYGFAKYMNANTKAFDMYD